MEIIFAKIIGIFSIVFIGYGASKLGWLPTESGKYLSKILINIAQPCIILYTITHQTLNAEVFSSVRWLLIVMLIVSALSTAGGFLFVRALKIPLAEQGIYIFCLTYTNNGFLGLPVAQALFGADGLFLMIMGNLLTILLIFTAGILTITYGAKERRSGKETLKSIFNLPMLAGILGFILLLLHWRLPVPVEEVILSLGNMMVPLSMLIIGIQLAGSNAQAVFSEKRYYWLSLGRLVLIPALLFVILTQFALPPLLICVLVLTAALPPPVLAAVFAEEYGRNVKTAAEGVFMTTLFSILTLPIVSLLLTLYLGS